MREDSSKSAAIDEPVMLKREVAAALRCSERTVYSLLQKRAFPRAYRLKRNWRIPASDVEAFKSRQQSQPPRDRPGG